MEGKVCDPKQSMEMKPCETQPCNVIDCAFSEWSSWGACTCTGLQERHRSIAQHYTYGGSACVGAKIESKECTPNCEPAPQDCQLGQWSDWSYCSNSCDGGQQFRTRLVELEAQGLGAKPCADNSLKEIQPCNEEVSCHPRVNCVLDEWSAWSECSASCEGGEQMRTRDVALPNAHGGLPCADDVQQLRSCNEQACDTTVDCAWGEWTSWSACSRSCGGGQQQRDRELAYAPRGAGKLCEANAKSEVAACNAQACEEVCSDGEWGEWSAWSACTSSCETGYMLRTRVITKEPNHCGQPAVGHVHEYQTCNEGVSCDTQVQDCSFGEWTAWGDCTSECNGIKERTRIFNVFAANGGALCDGPMKEIEACNERCQHDREKLAPIDCVLGQWTNWSECSAKCDGGTVERSRDVMVYPKNNGKPCPESNIHDTKGCNAFPCNQKEPCKWSDWSVWGECSKSCGGGQKTRARSVQHMPKNGGNPCYAQDAVETQACNEQVCGTPTFCTWTPWSDYSGCSSSCGQGTRYKARSLILTTNKPQEESEIMADIGLSEIPNELHKYGQTQDSGMAWLYGSDSVDTQSKAQLIPTSSGPNEGLNILMMFGMGVFSSFLLISLGMAYYYRGTTVTVDGESLIGGGGWTMEPEHSQSRGLMEQEMQAME